ncbi:putative serine/threonine-protein kinase-like protein CCR3 [Aegilops tauschii subsp. strangulata]|uniref:Protein kinase domain-containing protein n=1 Tax=Aegilops tauschii subsp. strangulata TaxID=200361 RepID=A0A452XV04_AEGTS|nr:putative serine/threonine-protein kinase-like protein CCR3 [Aegilops tauschii subsp. strangulata]
MTRAQSIPQLAAALLLPFLLLLLLLAHAEVAASTLAVAGGSAVCGVAADNGTVYCVAATAGSSAYNASASPVAPQLVFSQVSGGAGFLCGVGAVPGGGGAPGALFCWAPAAPGQLRRVYRGPAPLSDLAVGADHVAAYDGQARGIRWWRRGSGQFPELALGAFGSLVSGDGFTCALQTGNSSSAVRCWGLRGSDVQAAFANVSVSSLAAGGSRACGVVSATGAVLCSGFVDKLPQNDIYPHGLAVGDSHACGLRRPNRTAVCWNLAGPTPTMYYPAFGTAFEFLVAGGNLTCGLVTANFTVQCWSSTSSVVDNEAVMVPLPAILPGSCVRNESSCECGVYPRSGELCASAGAGGGVICNRLCDNSTPPPAPASPPQSPTTATKPVSKVWIAFAVVGAVGVFAGICSIIYCFVFGFCSHKRIHNSVQPNIASNAPAAAADNVGAVGVGVGAVASPYGSPNGSRARGLFRRQLSRAMTRQRSGPSSFNFKEHTEEYTFAQLATATNGFAPEAKIGAGSFGTVYRGKLPDGREVAIKRGEASGPMARKFQEKESAFRSELAFLSRLHHKHLVGLVGYCEENDERLLVYEYMKNGALYDHLHPKGGGADADAASPVVSSWKLRIKILLDASRGIEYLHSYAVPPIIHRDIKSSNILLDGGWVARVSDFGLSLMGPPETEEAGGAQAPQQHLSMKAAGTVGYMDPEYYGLHHLTVKSDVYGFGVVMLETLTGKRAIFKEAEGGSPVSVVDYAQPSIVAGELGKVLDGRAPEPSPHEAEAVELVAYTAVHCVRLEGKDRPAMADIVANLETAFALCEGSAGGSRGAGGTTTGGGFGNSSSSASLSMTSMELSGRLAE